MNSWVAKSTLLGAAQGAAEAVVVFALSEKYTLANDWFLVVMLVFANASGFAVSARFGLSLVGVAIAGGIGLIVGGWIGVKVIGSYEYSVPTPPEERVMRIRARDGEREVRIPGVPDEHVRRVPVGGGIGVLVGWALGAGVYAWISRRRSADDEFEEDESSSQT